MDFLVPGRQNEYLAGFGVAFSDFWCCCATILGVFAWIFWFQGIKVRILRDVTWLLPAFGPDFGCIAWIFCGQGVKMRILRDWAWIFQAFGAAAPNFWVFCVDSLVSGRQIECFEGFGLVFSGFWCCHA